MDFELAVSRVKPQRHKYASLLVLECCLFLLELCLCLIIQKESHNGWQLAEANGGKDKYTIRRHSIFYLSIITWLLHCCPSLWRLCKQNAALLHLWCCIASVVSYLLYHQLTEQEYVLQSNLFPISLSELFMPLWIKDWGWRRAGDGVVGLPIAENGFCLENCIDSIFQHLSGQWRLLNRRCTKGTGCFFCTNMAALLNLKQWIQERFH